MKGQYYSYRRGDQWVVCAWPPKRPKGGTAAQKRAQEDFLRVIQFMKLTAAEIQLMHLWAAEGTPMLPRDSLMAALYGRGPSIQFYSGKVIKPMANRVDASTVLDALGWTPGDILFRGPKYWSILPGGETGQVLTFDADAQKPIWAAGGGGGGSSGWSAFPISDTSAGATVTFGSRFRAGMPVRLKDIAITANGDGPRRLKARLFHEHNSDAFGTLIAETPWISRDMVDKEEIRFSFVEQPLLEKLGSYQIVWENSPGGVPTPTSMRRGHGGIMGQWADTIGPYLWSSNPPVSGAYFSQGGVGQHYSYLSWDL